MAYAAVTSLYHTIDLLLSSTRTSIDPSSHITLKCARWIAERLQATLRNYDKIKNSSDEVLAVDARIRDETRKLEETIEVQASDQFLSQSQSHGRFFLDLSHLSHDVSCFLREAEVLSEEYMDELYRPEEEEFAVAAGGAGAGVVHLSTTSAEADGNIVGFDDLFDEIRDRIVGAEGDDRRASFKCIAITGMAGIGKTTLVKKIFHDPLVMRKYKNRVFVRVGQKYDFEQILRAIISQLNVKIIMGGDEKMLHFFSRCLNVRRLLIVLDDAWDDISTATRDGYRRKFLIDLVVRGVCDACVLVTSRIDGIKYHTKTYGIRDYSHAYRMRFLNEVERWELLQRKVFRENYYSCPPHLVKAGKKIAENCEGLPLLIISVAHFLIKAPKELKYWEEVANMKNSVFEDACDLIHEVKNLWLAEGFADGVSFILDDIVSSNLVVTRLRNWSLTKAKACNLHIVNRHLSRRVAEDNKFIFVLKTYQVGGPSERIRDRPHLAIYYNSLLAMKEVHRSIEKISNLRSMLCTGTYHPYQVPVCMELKLLRVLDAVTIRFYEFPIEVVELIQLRYLSLSTNANLPPSINRMWFLEYLIVHQHLSIVKGSSSAGATDESESYVPVEIWEMVQLKHLQLIGRNLPPPPLGGILSNLTTLLDVGAQSCATEVLQSVPKLEKLRIRIESAPHLALTMPHFDRFCHDRLKSLSTVVFNPKLLNMPALPPRLHVSGLMTGLEKLSLSGFGYPWEDMSQVAKLLCLKVLKLQCYAFRGEEWAPNPRIRFKGLRYLLIEDTDLVRWVGAQPFPELTHLTMRNCHRLHFFPLIKTLNIELVDCNPLAEACARKIVKCDVRVECSWK